jgi:hypothetical protein
LPFNSGSAFPVTITFTPSAAEAGPYNTTLTATNGADIHTGTFPVSGVAAIAQTITVTSPSAALTKVNFGVAPVDLEATATSGLAVVFTTPTTTITPPVCTVAGGIVTFTNNGTCTIDANQAGNSDYAPAPQKVNTFSVAALSPRLTNLTPTSNALHDKTDSARGSQLQHDLQCRADLLRFRRRSRQGQRCRH